MADTLASTIKASVEWLFQDTMADGTVVVDQNKFEASESLADGTGADQADKVYHASGTLAATTALTLDLTSLSHSLYGTAVAISFAKLKAILLMNLSTTAGDILRVGPNANGTPLAAHIEAPFQSGVSTYQQNSVVAVGADSPLLLCSKKDGWAVANGATDQLRIYNPGATAVDYKLVLIGASA